MTDAPRFEGFADTRARFFGELTLHNDRDWFETHRGEYQEGWLEPMKALLGELRPLVARSYPGRGVAPPKVFRIHRDVRFSKDKSPYKTHVGGMLPVEAPRGDRSQVEVPLALYFHVAYDELFAGAGLYGMDPEALARHRAALLDPRRGAELSRIAASLTRRGYSLAAREATRRPPPGVDPDHPRAELLKLKGLVAMGPALPRRLLTSRELVGALAGQARAAAPLVRWLLRHVA